MQYKTEEEIKVGRCAREALGSFIGEPLTPQNLKTIKLKMKEVIDIFLKREMDRGAFGYPAINLKADKNDPSLIHICIGKIDEEKDE